MEPDTQTTLARVNRAEYCVLQVPGRKFLEQWLLAFLKSFQDLDESSGHLSIPKFSG
jgi:hypothetical protein